jgi:3-methyladenine DNA glycosylase AlkC
MNFLLFLNCVHFLKQEAEQSLQEVETSSEHMNQTEHRGAEKAEKKSVPKSYQEEGKAVSEVCTKHTRVKRLKVCVLQSVL